MIPSTAGYEDSMDRRKFLLGVGGASIGGSALLGSGAFSRVESQRSVEIAVAEDPDAYLGLDECDSIHGDNYVELDEKGHLQVDISENPNGGEGVNSNSRTWFHNVFEICNQGKQDACVWIEKDDDWPEVEEEPYEGEPRVDFYLEDDDEESILGAENAQELELGECVCIGIRTITHGVDANREEALLDELDDTITLVADVECPDPEDPPDIECPEEETWDEIGDIDEAGGPVILMGLDSEQDASDGSHGPIDEHGDMVQSMLNDVSNDGEGILVLGAAVGRARYGADNAGDYWNNVGDEIDVDVTLIEGEDNIENELQGLNEDDYAIIGIASSEDQITDFAFSTTALTDAENEAIIENRDALANFVNAGGGLLGKTQDGMTNPYGYLDPFGEIEALVGIDGAGYGNCPGCIEVTDQGENLGLVEENWSDWCCWHDVFLQFPDFLDVLAWNRDPDSVATDEVAALGGSSVIVEREVSLRITGLEAIEVGGEECYDVEIVNQGTETITDAEFEVELVNGSGSVDYDGLPDTVTHDPDERESWEDAICIECEDEGLLEVEVRLVGSDGVQLVDVTMDIECVDELPDEC